MSDASSTNIMNSTRTIGVILLVFLMIYAVTQIMTFYNVNTSQYSMYFTFYLFLFISAFVLPRQIPGL